MNRWILIAGAAAFALAGFSVQAAERGKSAGTPRPARTVPGNSGALVLPLSPVIPPTAPVLVPTAPAMPSQQPVMIPTQPVTSPGDAAVMPTQPVTLPSAVPADDPSQTPP